MKKVQVIGGEWKLSADYNSMVFDRNENPNAAAEMNAFLIMLLNNGYEACVRAEGCLYIVEYNNDPNRFNYGNDRLMWVAAEEQESIFYNREDDEPIR